MIEEVTKNHKEINFVKPNSIEFDDMAREKSGDYYNKQDDCYDCLVYFPEKQHQFAKIGSYVSGLSDTRQEQISQIIWNQAVKEL